MRRPIPTARRRAKRDALRAAILDTADRAGKLSTDRIVAAAKSPKNPLHDQFEWDDSVAAHQQRLGVARALIRDIVYVGEDLEGNVVQTIAFVQEPGVFNRSSFIPLSSAVRNKAMSLAIIAAELARCEGNIRRTQEIADVLKMRKDVDTVLMQLITLQKKVERATARIGRSKRTGREDRPSA
jgi:hypothetical protein